MLENLRGENPERIENQEYLWYQSMIS
jgi:hypothetical protein